MTLHELLIARYTYMPPEPFYSAESTLQLRIANKGVCALSQKCMLRVIHDPDLTHKEHT